VVNLQIPLFLLAESYLAAQVVLLFSDVAFEAYSLIIAVLLKIFVYMSCSELDFIA